MEIERILMRRRDISRLRRLANVCFAKRKRSHPPAPAACLRNGAFRPRGMLQPCTQLSRAPPEPIPAYPLRMRMILSLTHRESIMWICIWPQGLPQMIITWSVCARGAVCFWCCSASLAGCIMHALTNHDTPLRLWSFRTGSLASASYPDSFAVT